MLVLAAGCATTPASVTPDIELQADDQHADPLKLVPELLENRETPGNLERAIAVLNWHLKQQPGSVDFHALLAEAHSRFVETLDLKKAEDQPRHKEHRTEGLKHAEEAVAIDPGHAPAQYWLAALLLHVADAESSLGKAKEALTHLDRADSLHASIDSGGPARLRGRVLADIPGLFGGSTSKAIASYQSSLKVAPDCLTTHLWLGEAYVEAKKPDLARKEFE